VSNQSKPGASGFLYLFASGICGAGRQLCLESQNLVGVPSKLGRSFGYEPWLGQFRHRSAATWAAGQLWRLSLCVWLELVGWVPEAGRPSRVWFGQHVRPVLSTRLRLGPPLRALYLYRLCLYFESYCILLFLRPRCPTTTLTPSSPSPRYGPSQNPSETREAHHALCSNNTTNSCHSYHRKFHALSNSTLPTLGTSIMPRRSRSRPAPRSTCRSGSPRCW
jgi:hypothetical protein